MKKRLLQFAASFLLITMLLPTGAMAAPGLGPDHMVRIGLAYSGSEIGTMAAANLINSTDAGYSFGYLDGEGVFHSVGYTTQTEITMLKSQSLYLVNGGYSDTQTSAAAVGCYHIRLPGNYAAFEDAQAVASSVSGGFPAWIDGTYQVRVGSYVTREEALNAQAAMGLGQGTIVGTSAAGITVARTGTIQVLFQFDGGNLGTTLAVRPGLQDYTTAVTWFRGFKYPGIFQYLRNGDNGNMTVVNWVPMEQYVKGVAPYEIGAGSPMEALKAQAICNRSYGAVQYNQHRHDDKGFDLCNTTHCQVYRGAGSSAVSPSEESNRACDETAGVYAWYGDNYAQTYYYSSNGGATEDVSNVWNNSGIPYLVGMQDPYESYVADRIPQYRWTHTYTADELSSILNAKGYQGKVVDFYVSKYTDAGNVYSITFTCSNGKSYTFSKEKARTFLGMGRSSMHFTIFKGSGNFYVNQDDIVFGVSGLYAVDGKGKLSAVRNGAYAITSSGVEVLTSVSTNSVEDEIWTVSGAGWGHNIGMSQWGAISMAEQGYTYEQILHYYYPGISLGAY